MKVAVSGASGKTGRLLIQSLIQSGHQPRLLVKPSSQLPEAFQALNIHSVNIQDASSLTDALAGCDALVIATGARPSLNLLGPKTVDYHAVATQVQACKAQGVKRVILISALCAGHHFHWLNCFGLVLLFKRKGEKVLEASGLDWTIIRPGQLSDRTIQLEEAS